MTPFSSDNNAALEALLAETSWLVGVASGYGCSGQAADDAVQETLLAALSAEGDEQGRGWLRTVLRQRIGMQRRANERRLKREALVARAERVDLDPSSALEGIELNGRLRRAVAELPRKEREVIALRFGAGLRPAEIAESLGETATAVSARLSRALAKLRHTLDDETDSKSRFRALAGVPLLTAAAMKKNLVLLAILVVVAGLVPVGLGLLRDERPQAPVQEMLEPTLVAVEGRPEGPPALEPGPQRAVTRAAAPFEVTAKGLSDGADEVAPEAEPVGGTVRVLVTEAVTGDPAAGVGVGLVRFSGGAFWNQTRRGVTDSKGLVVFHNVSPGERTVYFEGLGPSGSYGADGVTVSAGETALVEYAVDGSSPVLGLVENEAGAPVPGARIWVARCMGSNWEGHFAATSDERGGFEVNYVGPTQFISASAPGYAPAPSAAFGLGQPVDAEGRLRLVLGARRGAVRGTVVGTDGAPVPGAMVTLGNRRVPIPDGEKRPSYQTPPTQMSKTDDLGRFEFEDAGVGGQWLQARIEGSGLWAEPVSVTDGGNLDVVVRLAPGGSIKGRVTDAAGASCPDATIQVLAAIDGAMSRMETQTGEGGEFELHGVTSGSVHFQVQDSEWARTLREHVQINSDQVTVWNPVLPDHKVLRGRVLSESGEPLVGWMVSTRPVEDGVARRSSMSSRTNSRGAFSFSPDYGEFFEISVSPPADFFNPVLTLEPMEIPEDSRDLVIPDDLVPSAGVVGRVVGVDGEGIRATVDVTFTGLQSRHLSVRAKSDGTFHVDYLPDAAFEISVLADGLPKKVISSTSPLVKDEIRDLGNIVLTKE